MQQIVISFLSNYSHMGQQLYQTVTTMSLTDIKIFLRFFLVHIPFAPVLLSFHCLNAALNTHDLLPAHVHWLKSLVMTFVTAFAGATLAFTLSGLPAPPFTTKSDLMVLCTLSFWYIVRRSTTFRYFCQLRLCRTVIAFGATAARMRAMMAFMDLYVQRFPGVITGAVICGGLAASAGLLCVSVEKIIQHGLGTHSEFSKPGWGFKSAFIAAACYFMLLNPNESLPIQFLGLSKQSVMFYISLIFCVHAALDAAYGSHVNPLYWIETILLAITGLNPPQATTTTTYTSELAEAHAKKEYFRKDKVESKRHFADSPLSCMSESSDTSVSTDSYRPHIMDSGLRKRRS